MVWKSNLDETCQEFIEDFGAKTGDHPQSAPAPKKPPTASRPTSKMTAAKKPSGSSPQKSTMGGDMNHDYVQQDDGQGGSGEELAQTLEKVVS